MKHFIFSCLFLVTLASCSTDPVVLESQIFEEDANTRSDSDLSVTLTLENRSVVTFTADKVSATAINDNVFTFVKEPGTLNQQTYQVIGATVSKTENHIDITVNPGNNAVPYDDKNQLILSVGKCHGCSDPEWQYHHNGYRHYRRRQ
ncbi:MAG: hypothetical protein IPK46_06340 [Saprospiraceae bacterium]|nr:hypothetical protein [Saprospiraceae bacterium]